MRVLVTGGGGFIGSHIVDGLLEKGHDVRVLDNFATGRRENLLHVFGDIEIVEGDIQSYERTHNAVKGCDVVFHQAALPSVPRSVQDPLTSNAVNVVGTLNILLCARDTDVGRVIFASSSSVYGATPGLPMVETMPTLPFSPYAVAKLAGENYCRAFSSVYGLETVALRYFNVFGPRQDPLSQYAAVIPNFIGAVLDGRPPLIYGDGEQSRDFTHVSNVVAGNLLALHAPDVAGRAFNLACGTRITLNAMLDEVKRQIGSDIQPEYLPPRPGDVRDSLAGIDEARNHLGYEPTTGFAEGLASTLEDFRRLRRGAGAAAGLTG